MKWFDQWLYAKVRDMWDNREKYENFKLPELKMAISGAQVSAISRGQPEGEDRITFELSTAIGGRILNVRRYDNKTDRHDTQTYVIPQGVDIGERVTKIINMEIIK